MRREEGKANKMWDGAATGRQPNTTYRKKTLPMSCMQTQYFAECDIEDKLLCKLSLTAFGMKGLNTSNLPNKHPQGQTSKSVSQGSKNNLFAFFYQFKRLKCIL